MTFNEVVVEAEAQGWTVVESVGRWTFTCDQGAVGCTKPVTDRRLLNLIEGLKSYGFVER